MYVRTLRQIAAEPKGTLTAMNTTIFVSIELSG